jgi:hypothetical protein
MRRQRTKQCEAWRRRREQYLRESGRHVELIKEGYASADSTNWTVIVGGRARGPLHRDRGTRLFLVKESVSMFALSAKKAVDQQSEDRAPQKRSRRGRR